MSKLEDLISKMSSKLKDPSIPVESIVDEYCEFHDDKKGKLLRENLITSLKIMRMEYLEKDMRIYLVSIQFQSDERCETDYLVYSKETDPEVIEEMVVSLPNYWDIEQQCIDEYADYFNNGDDESDDEDEELWASPSVQDITDEDYVGGKWFNSLPILIDERNG